MKVWLGCATDYYTSQPGNKNRPYGAMTVGDVILIYHFKPPDTCAEWKRLAWFPVEIGDYVDDVDAFVAAYPKPDGWFGMNSQQRMKFYDNARQIRESEIAHEWADAEGINPSGHGVCAPRLRLDVDALKAASAKDSEKIDKCFDPEHKPEADDVPSIEFGTIKQCCNSVNTAFHADAVTRCRHGSQMRPHA